MHHIGIDLGGTKTEIICLDADRRERYRKRVPSPQNDYAATIAHLCALIAEAENIIGAQATVGIGIPGSINYSNSNPNKQRVRNSNSTWLNGQPLQTDIQNQLQREIKLANDANCFTLSEAMDGAGSHAESVFGVIIGTGCGGGFYHRSQIVNGHMGIAGEWGHNPLPYPLIHGIDSTLKEFFDRSGKIETSAIYQHKATILYDSPASEFSEYPGPLCYCGKRGCLETWISGTGFANDHYRITGERLDAVTIARRAAEGQQQAVATLDRYCERFAKSLAQVINTFDPQVIILGGGMSNIELLYQELPRRWDKYVFSDRVATELRSAQHGDASGVRGAAFLWQ